MRKKTKPTRVTGLQANILNTLKPKKTPQGWVVMDLSTHPPGIWGPYESRTAAELDRLALAKAFLRIAQEETRNHDHP